MWTFTVLFTLRISELLSRKQVVLLPNSIHINDITGFELRNQYMEYICNI